MKMLYMASQMDLQYSTEKTDGDNAPIISLIRNRNTSISIVMGIKCGSFFFFFFYLKYCLLPLFLSVVPCLGGKLADNWADLLSLEDICFL